MCASADWRIRGGGWVGLYTVLLHVVHVWEWRYSLLCAYQKKVLHIPLHPKPFFWKNWNIIIAVYVPENLEKGGPCWLLILRGMGTWRVQMKGVLPWVVRWACSAGTRNFCSALPALVSPAQNIFFLTEHYFNSFVPIPPPKKKAGGAVVLGCLSLSMSLVCTF